MKGFSDRLNRSGEHDVKEALTSGRTFREVSSDLGVGNSTLGTWKLAFEEADLMSGPHDDTIKDLARLRRENELLRVERDLLKKAQDTFATKPKRHSPFRCHQTERELVLCHRHSIPPRIVIPPEGGIRASLNMNLNFGLARVPACAGMTERGELIRVPSVSAITLA